MRNDDPRNIFYNQRQNEQSTDEQQGKTDTKTQSAGNSGNGSGGAENSYEDKLAEMKRLAAKYEREGEGQLVKDILNNVLEQKASGNLSNEQLIAFAKRISPLLNAEQRARLNGLVEQLLKL